MGDNIEDVAVNDTDLDANNELVTSGEVETSNVEDSVNSQNDPVNDDMCDILDSTTNNDTDVLELSDSQKDLDAEKSNDSDDCDESRTERGKFVSERVTESNNGSDVVPAKNVERVHGARKKINPPPQRRNNFYNNHKMMHNDMRPRFNQHNRFRNPLEGPRLRANHGFMQPNFNPNVQFQQMQQMNAGVPIFANTSNFPNIPTIPQYPVQQQFIINPGTPFQNPYIINQIQLPQQVGNVQPMIPNQPNYGFAQIPMQINNMPMPQGFAFQQPAMSAPIPAGNSSNFNLAPPTNSTSTNNNPESRKVLINPHFKGRINVQEGINRTMLDDIVLLRQQEEFINQNRKNLQKRMHSSPRYSESPEPDYRPSLKSRHMQSRYRYKKNQDHRVDNSKAETQKKSAPVEEIVEDNETKEYRKRVEEQRKKREMFLKQKEERRRKRMQKRESMEVDSTVKEPLENPETPELHLDESKFKDDSIHNRLNKPVHLTGVLNLKTGLIKPKSKDADTPKTPESQTSTTPTKVQTVVDSKKDNANSTSPTKVNNVTNIDSITNDISVAKEEVSSPNVTESVLDKPMAPKAGFLGRRLVIASNTSKHNIVVQAENREPAEEKPAVSTGSGIFSKVVVNQELSDDDEDLSFLEESF